MKLTLKQISKIKDKFGEELTGEQFYWAYSTWGSKKEDLEEAGFRILSTSGFYSAKLKHSQDSDVLNFKLWKEAIIGGWCVIEEFLEDETFTHKQALKFMFDLAKEYHGKFPMTQRQGGIDMPISKNCAFMRMASFSWLYENKPKDWIVCEVCKT